MTFPSFPRRFPFLSPARARGLPLFFLDTILCLFFWAGVEGVTAEVRVAVVLPTPFNCSSSFFVSGKGRMQVWLPLAQELPRRVRSANPLFCNGSWFPSNFEVIRHRGTNYAVLVLDIEEYLLGVLPREMGVSWPLEALKAQAVVARTYAYRVLSRKPRAPLFDLLASETHQVYVYDPHPLPNVVEAVRQTRGEILRNAEGEMAEVAYHSCCGGRTAHSEEVWGKPNGVLTGVVDPYCSFCPNFYWSLELSSEEFGALLKLGPVKTLKILETTPSGRVKRLWVSDGKRERVLSGIELRELMGKERLRSTLFTLSLLRDGNPPRILIQGSGSGHGVGLCQWGARVQAEEGKNYREILNFYFPRARLSRI